jgi:threonine/homoserine/homoserine lactone efflux protein
MFRLMMNAMPAAASLWVFLLASLVLAVTPGPGVLFIIARTSSSGLSAGLVSVSAVALGNLASAIAAALGLAALFKVSSTAFALVKFSGACYLIYLAIAALRSQRRAGLMVDAASVRLASVFRDGFLVALLNPKTALFFAAFLPQFVTAGRDSARECIVLGAVFVLIAACTDAIYAVATALAKTRIMRLKTDSRAGSYAAAGVYASLGLYAAFSGATSLAPRS